MPAERKVQKLMQLSVSSDMNQENYSNRHARTKRIYHQLGPMKGPLDPHDGDAKMTHRTGSQGSSFFHLAIDPPHLAHTQSHRRHGVTANAILKGLHYRRQTAGAKLRQSRRFRLARPLPGSPGLRSPHGTLADAASFLIFSPSVGVRSFFVTSSSTCWTTLLT